MGFCWPEWFISGHPPPQVKFALCWAHLVLQCRLRASYSLMEYMILFPALFRGIFMHPWHTVQGLMLACMPPVLTLEGCACTCAHWTWKRTHRHSYTTTSAYITESSTLPEALVRCTRTYTRSQCIYLAQELTRSCFTCLIVLVGHEMRLLGCVSVEEKRWMVDREEKKHLTKISSNS